MLAVLWILLAFLSGALPLSYWLGRAALGVDIRRYGDGNPGAANLFRAGGRTWGTVGLLLDFAKGALPVAAANFAGGLKGGELVAAALAPIVGHAYSPFLRFHGGKALAVTFGVWCGLTLYVVPLVLGASLAVWLALLRQEAWSILLGLLILLIFLLLFLPDPILLAVWAGSLLILLWKQRQDFGAPDLSHGILARFLARR